MAGKPRVYRAEGVVLRRRNLGEADSIFIVYSRTDGKFEGVARGVRKAKSRMRGHLEPLTFSRFLLAKGRSLDVFTQAETVKPFRRLREDLDRGAAGVYCADLVERFTEFHQPQRELFDVFTELLDALEDGAPLTVVRCFEVHLLALLGYELQLDTCANCNTRLPEGEALLSSSAGGLVCGACRSDAGQGRVVSVHTIKALRFAQRVRPADFTRLRIDAGLAKHLQVTLGELLRYHLDYEVRSTRFVEDVAALPEPMTRASTTGNPTESESSL
jgi:DNA repair protein RecO (recombination protein O)